MSTDSSVEVVNPEVISGSALESIERATVDVQIATAHKFPRSMAKFRARATEMVTMDEETAQSCIYRRPIGKKNGEVEFAEGKSVRMAEIVGACYGNLRVGAIVVEMTERYVKARGFAHDLESNFAASSEVVEATVKRDGTPYDERMRVVIAKAALAKARRDATFQVVPGALCKSLEEAARTTAIGTTATLGARRQRIMDWINKAGLEPARVWAALNIKGIEDVGLEQLETLTGIRTAIKDGDVTLDDAFPRAAVQMPTAKKTEAKAEPPPAAEGDNQPAPPPAETAAGMTRAEAINIIKAAPKGPQKRALAKRDLTPENYETASDIILAEVAQMLVKGEA